MWSLRRVACRFFESLDFVAQNKNNVLVLSSFLFFSYVSLSTSCIRENRVLIHEWLVTRVLTDSALIDILSRRHYCPPLVSSYIRISLFREKFVNLKERKREYIKRWYKNTLRWDLTVGLEDRRLLRATRRNAISSHFVFVWKIVISSFHKCKLMYQGFRSCSRSPRLYTIYTRKFNLN